MCESYDTRGRPQLQESENAFTGNDFLVRPDPICFRIAKEWNSWLSQNLVYLALFKTAVRSET